MSLAMQLYPYNFLAFSNTPIKNIIRITDETDMGIIVSNNIYAFTRNGILHSYTIIYWPKAKKDRLCMIFTCKKPK